MKPLVALFAATIFLSACSTNQASVHAVKAVNETPAAAPLQSAPSGATPSLGLGQVANTPAATTAAPAPAAVIRPNPPRQPLPPFVLGHPPRIAICTLLPIGLQPQPIKGIRPVQVCGSGFAAGEIVTLSLTGGLGQTSWTVAAGTGGTFESTVAPAACRFVRGILVARGNRGHVSNPLLLPPLPCRLGS